MPRKVVLELLARLFELIVAGAQLVRLALQQLGVLQLLALDLLDPLQLAIVQLVLLAQLHQMITELLHLRLVLLLFLVSVPEQLLERVVLLLHGAETCRSASFCFTSS